MPVASADQIAEAALWVQQFTTASEELKGSAEETARSAWLSFSGWYDAAAVAAMAKDLAGLSLAAQQRTAGLAAQYVTNVAAVTADSRLAAIGGSGAVQVIRNDVPLSLVYTRPAQAFKKAIATGADHDEAVALSGSRGAGLMRSDLSLQDRSVMSAVMENAGVSEFRRVIRPELSKTGTCGLCIVAADRIYRTGNLMPIHPPSCACIVMPIVGESDPGASLNREDLDALYAAAGSNKAADLRRTRYTVNEHGEFGPVITKAGDNFRGPDSVALEDDPDRAGRMLDKTRPVLADLERRAAAGEDVTSPLEYQRELVARLRRIVGATASAA